MMDYTDFKIIVKLKKESKNKILINHPKNQARVANRQVPDKLQRINKVMKNWCQRLM